MDKALSVIPGNEGIMPELTPQQQVEKASEMAKVLQTVVKQANLAKNLGGKKDHLEYEAWQTIAQFFSCTPVTEWSRPITNEDKIIGYEARVNVINSEGRIIATAESMCMRDEPNWKNKPLYSLRSMAQTRTAGKAMRSVFAWVAVLAGYSGTPAEEMTPEFYKKKKDTPSSPETLSDAQLKKIRAMIGQKDIPSEQKNLFYSWLKKEKASLIEVNGKQVMTKASATDIIDQFETYFAEFCNPVEEELPPPEEEYTCDLCGFHASSERGLKKHKTQRHNGGETPPPENTDHSAEDEAWETHMNGFLEADEDIYNDVMRSCGYSNRHAVPRMERPRVYGELKAAFDSQPVGEEQI